jgi:fumarate hydratase subunit alpha
MKTRKVRSSDIEKTVEKLCIKANTVLRPDVLSAFKKMHKREKNPRAKKMLKVLLDNSAIADREKLALCQDTGMVAVFIGIGQDARITGGDLSRAVNKGVAKAYKKGHFRNSVVKDPVNRKNTGDNTPAVIHTEVVKGDKVRITVLPKGFGAENKSRIAMLNPTCTPGEIADFCVDTVRLAGPDACPPYMLGIGLGGTVEQCAYLAKKALLRPVGKTSRKKHIAKIEKDIMKKANALKIGIMGLGGNTTVMGVSIEDAPTHIAGCPVAVNISCHALRSASAVL